MGAIDLKTKSWMVNRWSKKNGFFEIEISKDAKTLVVSHDKQKLNLMPLSIDSKKQKGGEPY